MTGLTADSRPVAVVMGASRGLGLLCAAQLAHDGNRVVLVSRSRERCERARDQLGQCGVPLDRLVVKECDARDGEAVESLIRHIEDEFGPIEIGLHVAGIIQVGPWQAWTHADFTDAIDTMLWGPVNFCLPLARRMTQRGHGRIGVVSSIGGRVAAPHLLPYSTAKFAAFGFGQGLATELSGTGVTLTNVVPGLMRVGSHLSASFTGDQQKEFAWFSAGASAPLLAMNADRAARRIVTAVSHGRPVLTLTPLAIIGSRVAGVAPGLTTRVLGLMGRLLPDPDTQAGAAAPQSAADGTRHTQPGYAVRRGLRPAVRHTLDRLTALGERAARRNLEPR